MKVGDLVLRRVDYGIDKGAGLIKAAREDISARHYKIHWSLDQEFTQWYESCELRLLSESR